METKSQLQQILESNECDTSLVQVPETFETAPRVVDPHESSTNFNTKRLFEISQLSSSESKSAADRYWHARRYYLNQIRASSRKQMNESEQKIIKEILKSGDKEKIKELFCNRHKWRTAIHEFRGDDKPICEAENCPHLALIGSKFCINHIMMDKEQKLFVECSNCHQPHPVFTKCFCCNH